MPEPSRRRSDAVAARRAALAAALLCSAAAGVAFGDERAAVVEAMQAWERAVEARRYDELADYYAVDAIYYPHEAAAIVGRDAIIARNRDRGSAASVDITQHVDDVQVNGSWAVYSCVAEIRVSGAGNASTRHVRVLLLMQRGEDGRWRIFRDIDNGTPDRPSSTSAKGNSP